MFIKHGDGKITTIIDAEDLSEEQKEAMKKTSKQTDKQEKAKTEKLEN